MGWLSPRPVLHQLLCWRPLGSELCWVLLGAVLLHPQTPIFPAYSKKGITFQLSERHCKCKGVKKRTDPRNICNLFA